MNLTLQHHLGARRVGKLLGTMCLAAAGALAFALVSTPDPVEAKSFSTLEAQAVAASTRVETETYIASIMPPASIPVGKEVTIEINIKPKAPYHINMQYPFKFKLADPPPDLIEFTKTTLVRADGTFVEQGASMKLPVKAKAGGQAKIVGKLSLSVCSEANCVMDKVELEATVDAR